MNKLYIMQNIPSAGFTTTLLGWEIVFASEDQMAHEAMVAEMQGSVAVVSVFGRKLTREMMAQVPSLRMVANYGAGFDNIDLGYCNDHNILVTNCPAPVTEPTAELAMGLMVAVARQIVLKDRQLRQPGTLTWGVMNNLSHTLYGKTLGIVGMGKIGKAIARRALAFGMKVIYHNRKPLPESEELKYQAAYHSFDSLLAVADVVSLSTPLTDATRHLMDARALGLMKPTAILVNTARGAVVDEKALIEALEKNIIAGAGLDVYEDEPNVSPALLMMDQVVLMPHLGSGTIEAREEMSFVVASNILSAFKGEMPENAVNHEVFVFFKQLIADL